jgi:glycyl-tRNA synthetase
MHNIHNVNGLVFWTGDHIQYRQHAVEQIARRVQNTLWFSNPAWAFEQIEGSVLVPRSIINQEYTDADVWAQSGPETAVPLVLRPETTPSTYAYARAVFDAQSSWKPPVCFWQVGKSFRREQEQPTKFMRLKEFYQQEFQCIYTADTKNDYRAVVLERVAPMIRNLCAANQVRIVESDRIPVYAESTLDIEVYDEWHDRWMEIASASIRTDFPGTYTFTTNKGSVEKTLKVFELAVGVDRIVYQRFSMGG